MLETDIDVVPGTSGRRSKKPKKYVDSDSEDNGRYNLGISVNLNCFH